MRIVVAPDKFKGSLTARAAGDAIARGMARAFPQAAFDIVPVADGGDGTAEVLVDALGGKMMSRDVTGPDGVTVAAAYGSLPNARAVIEMARASGLALIKTGKNDPLTATTYGTGQLIAAAIDAGAKNIILAIGGSATNDAGAGALAALGARFLDAAGAPVRPGGAPLSTVARIDIEPLRTRVHGISIDIASDVTNPLCGPNGASAIYGPQKGADPKEVRLLDEALSHFADVVERLIGARIRDVPGAGAAGGAGFGFMALAGARLRPGAELIFEVLGFERRLAGADLIVTGEGRLDRQTLAGKAPYAVAQAGRIRGIPVVAVVGALGCTADMLEEMGLKSAVSILSEPMTLAEASSRAAPLTEDAAERLGRALAVFLK
ncbi:MAG TPA: glycerate kinase [Candidatus Eremiobacteraceae bacterium]